MKIRNNQKYLKDSELTLYINNCLQILHRSEFLELFLENFSTPYTISLVNFSNIRFKFGDDLNEYYQKKAKLGHALGPHQNDESWCLSLFQLTGKNSNNKSNEETIHKNAYTFKKLRPLRPNLDNGHIPKKTMELSFPVQVATESTICTLSPQNPPKSCQAIPYTPNQT